MVKHFSRSSPNGGRGQHIRIGFSDLDHIWNAENEKYRVCCRSIHVSKAALYIGYGQLFISFVFCFLFAYQYAMTVSGHLPADHWLNQYYMSRLMLTVSLQVIIVVVMIHGVKTEKKAFLLPYIVYAAIAVLTSAIQIVNDMMNLDNSVTRHADVNARIAKGQFMGHLLRTFIQAWCLSIVWRCYGYLTEKKIARQVREQLSTTANAFHYPENLPGYAFMPQPPPYVDTVLRPNAVPSRIVIGPINDQPTVQQQNVPTGDGQAVVIGTK